MRVQRLLAPNPGIFTGPGTNTYLLVSEDECLVVDPGPVIDEHRVAILAGLEEIQARAVLVTHTHPDHAPLANPVAAELDIPAVGYSAGPDFEPDRVVRDGDVLSWGSSELRVLYTPGHSRDHLCFEADGVLFTGDHIMGGSTVVVEDMAAYLGSLRRLQSEATTQILPGHGEQMDDPQAVIASYLEHRLERERQIVAAVTAGAGTVGEIVEEVYIDVDTRLHPLAAHSVSAHLVKLDADEVVAFAGPSAGGDVWSAAVSTRQ